MSIVKEARAQYNAQKKESDKLKDKCAIARKTFSRFKEQFDPAFKAFHKREMPQQVWPPILCTTRTNITHEPGAIVCSTVGSPRREGVYLGKTNASVYTPFVGIEVVVDPKQDPNVLIINASRTGYGWRGTYIQEGEYVMSIHIDDFEVDNLLNILLDDDFDCTYECVEPLIYKYLGDETDG